MAALRTCLQALAAPGGTLQVLVVEDLHWADDSSLDLLQHLQDHAAELPLALVMTARPTLLARRPQWGTPDTRLLLAPLAAAHSDELAMALLQRLDPLPPQLLALIASRAEGNPYYMEELVRRLLDDGVIEVGPARWTARADRLEELRLPGTLVGLLQARLDALPASERHAARQASVIGHVFWDDALQALDAHAPQALPALQRAAFVKAHGTSDFADTNERQFDHHLLHQVTYDTLLKAERRLGHAAAARWLSERTQGRGGEFLAMTGEHAERAGDTALAITCFEQAGREAEQRFANAAAAAWLRRALTLLGESAPGRRLDLLARLEAIADTMGDRPVQEALHHDMATLLQQHPSESGQALLHWCQALLADRRSDTTTAQAHCQQAAALAERSGAAHTAARSRGLWGWLTLSQGDCEGARAHVDTGLSWAGRIEAPELRAVTEAQLHTISAMVSNELCHFGPARQALLAVLSRGEAIPSLRLQGAAMDNLAEAATRQGRWDEVAAWAQRLHALGVSCGAQRDIARAQTRMCLALWSMGDRAAALPWCEQSLVSHRRIGDRYMEAVTLCSLGWLHFEQGEVQTALGFCTQSQALYATPTENLQACGTTALVALCRVRLGQEQAAREAVDVVLGQLQGALVAHPARDTVDARWGCCTVLQALGDPRAPALLEQLHADVLARAAELTDAGDRQRLIQAVPSFRDIVAAYGQRGQHDQSQAAS
jgi:tetratricopeptide (TPR) repeat protein